MTASGRSVVVGANGQLGRALTARLPDAVSFNRSDLDTMDQESVERFDWSSVATVYNAAAYTAVDKAENDRAAAWAVNATGPAHLARAAARHGFTLVHTSTEYVFDGTETGPILEDAPLSPLGVYGASKTVGELAVATAPAHLVVRTSWLVGDGHNFVRTMRSLAERGIRPSVVCDQVGRPTFATDLADVLVELADRHSDGAPSGLFHASGDGEPVSWAGLAKPVFEHAGHAPDEVTEVTAAEYLSDKPPAAARPANSVLDMASLNDLGIKAQLWTESLTTYLDGAS